MKPKTWQPGMDRTFGLDHNGTTREVVRDLEGTGFGYVDLPPAGTYDRQKAVSRAYSMHKIIAKRFDPIPIHGYVVERDLEGDGPYYMISLGEEASFAGS